MEAVSEEVRKMHLEFRHKSRHSILVLVAGILAKDYKAKMYRRRLVIEMDCDDHPSIFGDHRSFFDIFHDLLKHWVGSTGRKATVGKLTKRLRRMQFVGAADMIEEVITAHLTEEDSDSESEDEIIEEDEELERELEEEAVEANEEDEGEELPPLEEEEEEEVIEDPEAEEEAKEIVIACEIETGDLEKNPVVINWMRKKAKIIKILAKSQKQENSN